MGTRCHRRPVALFLRGNRRFLRAISLGDDLRSSYRLHNRSGMALLL